MISRRFFCSLIVPLVVTLPACKRPAALTSNTPPVEKIYLLSAHGQRPFETGQKQWLTRVTASRPGFNFEALDAGGDADKQRLQLIEATTNRPFAILFTPVDAKSMEEALKAAQDAGIHLIGLDEKATELPLTTCIYTDQRELGKLAGQSVARALERKAREEGQAEIRGRVAQLRGDETSPECQARHDGFLETLRPHPGIVLVHDAPADWNREGGRQRLLEALRLQAPFDVIYAHNDAIALGAVEAANDQREQLFILGTDGLRGPEGGIDLVGLGELDATLYRPLGVDLAWRLLLRLREDPAFQAKPAYKLTPRLIQIRDVDDFRRNGPPPLPDL